MFLLRLRQTAEGIDRHVVSIELDDGPLRRTDERRFTLALSGQDREDLRWYLEDYLQYPLDPAPTIAARIEARMDEIGGELFGALFGGGSEIWSEVRHRLSDARIEIASSVQEAATIPWELLRDPDAGRPLALEARSFVRGVYNSVRRPNLPQTAEGPVRVLLVICRPRGGEDVSVRSVARRLVEGLRASDAVKLTVLRPPDV